MYYILNDTNKALCEINCGDTYPDTNYEIAMAMGFSVRSNGSCTSLSRYQNNLVNNAKELNLKFAF
jgi:hypothetical protein